MIARSTFELRFQFEPRHKLFAFTMLDPIITLYLSGQFQEGGGAVSMDGPSWPDVRFADRTEDARRDAEPPPLGLICHKQYPAVDARECFVTDSRNKEALKNQGPDLNAKFLRFACLWRLCARSDRPWLHQIDY